MLTVFLNKKIRVVENNVLGQICEYSQNRERHWWSFNKSLKSLKTCVVPNNDIVSKISEKSYPSAFCDAPFRAFHFKGGHDKWLWNNKFKEVIWLTASGVNIFKYRRSKLSSDSLKTERGGSFPMVSLFVYWNLIKSHFSLLKKFHLNHCHCRYRMSI